MLSAGVRLSIDYGAATTKAVLAWPDGRYQQLSLDAGGVLSTAVFVGPDGVVVTGGAAWQAAAEQPQRFVLSPLRVGDGQVSIEGVEVPVADLVAASLRRVADEAAHLAGERVTDVGLVVPAGWGPRRRTWMRQAAYRAGLGQPTLVEAPVAAADYFLALGARWPVGSFLLVCDIGAGAEAGCVN